MTIFYLDYVNGNDANDGSTWALAWKTITSGATAARIAPGDIIRIAKSPAPVSIGNGTWTNLSKIVTLATAQNFTINLCETAWTKNPTGDATVTLTAVATDAKEGANCMKILLDAAVQANIMQAYFATGELNLSAYQKISFWIKNSGAIVANNWIVNLCSDVAGATVVDSFLIPAIPSISQWIPLTLTKVGGGNLGASIKSIAVYSGATTTGMASKYIYIDDFIACTTDGLNLQSLISKNSLEQGGSEGWYGIQSINGVTILLDNYTNTKANDGRGYSTSGTTPETITTYKRETIKTDLVSTSSTIVQEVMDSGTPGNNIQFQGGYDTTSGNQTGETFFDGLNGFGFAIYLSSKSYITLNYLNVCRCDSGIYFNSSSNNTITNISNANNNGYGIYFYMATNNTITNIFNANNNERGIMFENLSDNNIITTITNVNNNTGCSVDLDVSNNNTITTISNSNNNYYNIYIFYCSNNTIGTITNANNGQYGVCFMYSSNNTITNISNSNNNTQYGIYFEASSNNIIRSLSTTGNVIAGVWNWVGMNYLYNALIGEAIEVAGIAFTNSRIFSHKHDQTAYHRIFTDGGQIDSVNTDRVGGTGIMWKLAVTSVNRASNYPLDLKIARIAVMANKLVTVKAYMKITNITDILGALVCKGGQLTGIENDVKTNASTADTNWHEITITFTPTEAGVIEIEAWAWWVANLADEFVYIEDMTISQAN